MQKPLPPKPHPPHLIRMMRALPISRTQHTQPHSSTLRALPILHALVLHAATLRSFVSASSPSSLPHPFKLLSTRICPESGSFILQFHDPEGLHHSLPVPTGVKVRLNEERRQAGRRAGAKRQLVLYPNISFPLFARNPSLVASLLAVPPLVLTTRQELLSHLPPLHLS